MMLQASEGTADRLAALLPPMVACSNTEEFGSRVLPALCALMDAPTAVMHYFVSNSARSLFFDPIYVNLSERYIDEFRERYSLQDPFPMAALERYLNGEGSAYSSDQLVDMAELEQSEFYRFFLQPQSIHHMLVIIVARGDEPFAVMGLHRPKTAKPFSSSDLELAEAIAPYLSAVADRVHMREELTIYQRALDTLSYNLMNKGVLVLDEKLTLVFANDYARSTLAGRKDFDPEIRRYPEVIADACRKLTARSAKSTDPTASADFAINGEEPAAEGYVRISEMAGHSKLFLAFFNTNEYGALNPRICDEYGLTRREMEITRYVIQGKSNSEVAEGLNISVRTVQNHLRSIYEKCEVNNRTSLSNRVLSLL